MSYRFNYFYLPVASALLSIAAFNTPFWFLSFSALVPLFLFLAYEKDWRRLVVGVFIYRLLFASGVTYFVLDPIMYGLSLLLFSGFAFSFYWIRKYWSLSVALASLPLIWLVWDYLEAHYTLLPMSILMFGNALAESSFLGLARIGGLLTLTFVVVLINTCIVLAILLKKRRTAVTIFTLVGIVMLQYSATMFLVKNHKDYEDLSHTANIALISALDNKFSRDDLLKMIYRDPETDLLVVPEDLYKSNLENFQSLIRFYGNIARDIKTPVLAVLVRSEQNRVYKSSLLFSAAGELTDIYNKNRLTITSEHWPLGNWRPYYFDLYMQGGISEEEKQRAIFDLRYEHTPGMPRALQSDSMRFSNPVCGELFYIDYMATLNNFNPQFIIHNSENDWIKRGLSQYIRLANWQRKITAVWLKKPVLVNGIKDNAGVFYPDGTSMLAYPESGPVLINVRIRF